MTPTAKVIYFLFLSATAAGLLLAVAYVGYAPQEPIDESDKLLVGGIFIAGCILCISMTISPNWPREYVRHRTRQMTEGERKTSVRGYVAHHPDCDSFRDHRIPWRDFEFCSGCLGLMIGSAASIALMVVYLFMTPGSFRDASHIAIAVGFCALSIVFLVSLLRRRGALLNVFANVLMVPGLFLLTVGMFEITGNLYAGLLPVLLSFLWVDARIQISQWHHSMTCCVCPSECKMY